MANFFDIVKEQQKTEEIKTLKLFGLSFLDEEIEIKSNTSYIFNLIISMSEEINGLSTKGLEEIEIDTDSIIDELDVDKIKRSKNNKEIEKKVIKGAKENIKEQLRSKKINLASSQKDIERLEDEIYEKYFFELPGVPTKDVFFEKLISARKLDYNQENIEMFSKFALMNKQKVDNKLMNVYEANLYEVSKHIEETYGMSMNFSKETSDGETDSNF